MKASELVNEARMEVDMGWTKGTWRNGDSVCSISALERVAMRHLSEGGVNVFPEAKKALSAKALEMFQSRSVPSVNDREGITKQDVLDLFDKAALGLQESGS